MQPPSDLDVYRRLTAMAEELDLMCQEPVTLVSGAALDAAATSLRGIASAVYQHCLSEDPSDES